MKISFKTLFKVPYENRPMSPAFELVLVCVFIVVLALCFRC